MRTVRRTIAFLVLLFIGALAAPPPAQAATTFCYTYLGHYIVCRTCEFYGPDGEYLGFIQTCWDREL